MSEEREATILLQVDDVTVNEVKGPNRTLLDKGTMTTLRIAATEEELSQLGAAVTCEAGETMNVSFVVIGEHKIPVIKNVPVLRKEERHYTFVMPGLFLEVVFPETTDPEEIEVFECTLKQEGVLRIKGEKPQSAVVTVDHTGSRAPPQASVGDKISGSITKISDKISTGIQSKTPVVQQKIAQGSGYACEKITPNENPAEIKESTTNNIRKTRMATRTAVLVSGQLATAMVQLAKTLGSQLGGAVSESSRGQQVAESGTATEVKKVAVAGVVAAGNVMEAGTEALKAVLTSACDGLSTVVGHKYGEEAGTACSDGLCIVKDVAEAGININQVGVKGLAKAAAKEAGKNVLNSGVSPPQQA
eukprot:TRINITY_DN5798_c0_g2_i1.p1 TRINITY_DN5798_c0_g2~~TRINITY_DN5798_c0_g2_i1.p1  ORF type:complete len:361 (+),score=88.07 TRINITY_DN5798_c0_g2_i1:66-1148(+)